jgi:organic radical activating enzyme
MRCSGFGTLYRVGDEERLGCDTWFAVEREFVTEWEAIEDISSLTERLVSHLSELHYVPHVVITGGEPLLYRNDDTFISLLEWLDDRGMKITFETNGTLVPDFDRYPVYRNATYALSVKLSNSGESKNRRINPDAIVSISRNASEAFFKFTLSRSAIENGIVDEIEDIANIPTSRVPIYCMPVGESREVLEKNDRAVFRFCIENGYIYSDRLHIRVFDTTQGV